MIRSYTFVSPICVYLPRKRNPDKPKRVSLNLNAYMHLHYHTINQARKIYFEKMRKQLEPYTFFEIEIEFVLWKSSSRNIDRSNFLSIVEKFFCDALVEHGCIEDDSDDFIINTKYSTGGIDRNNPRVEITVKEVF